jgi:hypothetical protein
MAGTTKTRKQEEAEGIKRRQSETVAKLVERAEQELDAKMKASLGDYIRLVQLQKDLEEEEVREIKVTWVEPEEALEEKVDEKTMTEGRPESES